MESLNSAGCVAWSNFRSGGSVFARGVTEFSAMEKSDPELHFGLEEKCCLLL
jgi:hypothetical protein